MKRILVVIVLILITFHGYSQCFNNKKDVKEKIVGKEFLLTAASFEKTFWNSAATRDKSAEVVIKFTSSDAEVKISTTTDIRRLICKKWSYNKKKDRGTLVFSYLGSSTSEAEIACRDGYYVLYVEKNGNVLAHPEKNSPLAKTVTERIKTLSNERTIKTPTNDRSSSASSSVETIKIGTQIWTKQNLNTSEFNNGDPIMEARTNSEWVSANEEKNTCLVLLRK